MEKAIVALAGTLLLANSAATAVEQGITGKRLLLRNTPKTQVLSSDPLIAVGVNGGSGDPRCAPQGSGLGGSMTLTHSAGYSITVTMPCANWSTNSRGTFYKYKDLASTPKTTAIIKAGRLRLSSIGGQGLPTASAATIDVRVSIGSDKYCLEFSGTGDGNGRKFLVKDAPAGACQHCGDNLREGTEMCDGSDAACPTFSYCSPDCSGCVPVPECPGGCWSGNGAVPELPACAPCCTQNDDCHYYCGLAAELMACDNAYVPYCEAAVATACAAECGCP